MPEIPFALQWTIPEDKLLLLKNSENRYLRSTYISNIPEFKYYLKIYPNGDKEEFRGQTWIFLHMKFKDVKKVEADFTLTIESANFSKTGHWIHEKITGWGKFICKTKKLFDPEKKFIVDEKFTVKINGIFKFETGNSISAAINEQKWAGGEVGNELWKKDDFKDFTIIIAADGNELKVHKNVLDARSDVFSAMLNSNMKETIENKVEIPNFSFKVVETGVKLIYHCTFTSTLSIDELIELLQFFDKYQLLSLKAKVEPYLINQISADTIVRLTNYSIFTNSFKLKEKCIEFLSASFASKIPLADIDELNKDIELEILQKSLYQIVQTEK